MPPAIPSVLLVVQNPANDFRTLCVLLVVQIPQNDVRTLCFLLAIQVQD